MYSHLLCVVWEVDFVEDLGAVQLDGIYLDLMWWELPGLHPTQKTANNMTHRACRHCECKSTVFIKEAMQMSHSEGDATWV